MVRSRSRAIRNNREEGFVSSPNCRSRKKTQAEEREHVAIVPLVEYKALKRQSKETSRALYETVNLVKGALLQVNLPLPLVIQTLVEEKHYKHLEHLNELGASAATTFAVHGKHKAKKDPKHAYRHKIEEEIGAVVAVGAEGLTFHEHHESKEAKKEEEEAYKKKHHHLF